MILARLLSTLTALTAVGLLLLRLSAATAAVAFMPQMADIPPPPPMLRGPVPKTLPVNLIPLDTERTEVVTRTKTEFKVLVHQDTGRSLSVTVTPCNARLNWDFKFIPLTNNMPIILGNNTSSGLGKTLVEYTGVLTPVTFEHTKAHKGLYVITAQAVDDGPVNVTFFWSLVQRPPKNFRFRPNGIKIKTGGQKISLRWNLSHEDFHLMKYSLVVSTSKIYLTLCEAQSRLEERRRWNSSLNSYSEDDLPLDDRLEIHHLEDSTNYTLTDLIYGKTYYFTVFSINGTRIPTIFANATYTFERPRPVGLKDAVPAIVNLRAQNGKVSFRYKMGIRSTEAGGDPKTLYWYVMPCGGVVNVEIRCRKTLLVKRRVFGYGKIVLNNTKLGERYLLKVETVSADETQRVGSIEVMATARPMLFPMPDMPSDLSIQQYPKPDDCKSVTIGWLPAKSFTDLKYCVYLLKPTPSNSILDFSTKPNQCELSYNSVRRRDIETAAYPRKIRCYVGGEKEKVSIQKILKLRALTTYIVQVTVSKPRGRTLSYDLLKLDTNSCGIN